MRGFHEIIFGSAILFTVFGNIIGNEPEDIHAEHKDKNMKEIGAPCEYDNQCDPALKCKENKCFCEPNSKCVCDHFHFWQQGACRIRAKTECINDKDNNPCVLGAFCKVADPEHTRKGICTCKEQYRTRTDGICNGGVSSSLFKQSFGTHSGIISIFILIGLSTLI